MLNFNLQLGEHYTKEEIEKIFQTDFGYGIKGITQRKFGDEPYIIIFSRKDGAYQDDLSGDVFTYKGEGREGDQSLTVANKALLESNTTGRIIFGFYQEENGAKWKYVGILEVIDFDYVYDQAEGRKMYEFKMVRKNIPSLEPVIFAQQEIETFSSLPVPILLREKNEVVSQIRKKVRGEAFRREVKKIYKNTCAVCEKSRFTKANYPEVQSAHIFPVELDGSDDLRNGIALCRLHHWAFDGGLFSLSDEAKVIIYPNMTRDKNYTEITEYDGKTLLIPDPQKYKPDPIFLNQHRIIHGF